MDDTQQSRKFSWAGVWNASTTSYYLLLGATIALTLFGLLMVLSSSSIESIGREGNAYSIFMKQALFAIVGFVGMAVAMQVPVRWYKKMAPFTLALAFALQSLVFVLPCGDNCEVLGNRNWIRLGPISLQPSEFMKIAIAVFLGTFIAYKLTTAKTWLQVVFPTLLPVVIATSLVMAGKDLGTVMVICLIIAACYFVAGLPWKWIAIVGGLGLAGITVAVLTSGNRMGRILATYDSSCTAADQLCYQVIRGEEGLGSGGLWGVGLGAGAEKWSYLPEAQNDFIFAVIGEEVGFLGTTAVILLFVVLAIGFGRLILRHPDPMVKITTAGIAAWILGQAIINIGVVTRVFPVIGIPLPLVSAGGSALVATMIALGVVISFSKSEPGAHEAFTAKPSVVRKAFAVISRPSNR